MPKKIRSYWFQVPWCVPAWGWAEFRALPTSLFTASARRGRMPEQFAESIKIRLGRRLAVPLARGREAIRLALETLHIQPGEPLPTTAGAFLAMESTSYNEMYSEGTGRVLSRGTLEKGSPK